MNLHSTSRYLLLLSAFMIFPLIKVASQANNSKTKNRVYQEDINQQFWSADWSPDGKYIAIAGVDSTVRIFHAKNLRLYKSFSIPNWIHIVEWNPDGNLLAVATLSEYVQLIDLHSGNIIKLDDKPDSSTHHDQKGSRAMSWNHTGELLAVGDLDGAIKIWNKQGQLMKSIAPYAADEEFVSYLALDWHPTENKFVAANFEIRVYNDSGNVLQEMAHQNPQAIMLCAEWHPIGEFFVIGDYGHNWEGENVRSLLHFWSKDGTYIKSVPGSPGEYRNISWNPSGTMLATASDMLRIWSVNGDLLYEGISDGTNYLWGIDWSPDGKKIVTSSKHKTVALWNKKAKLLNRIDVK